MNPPPPMFPAAPLHDIDANLRAQSLVGSDHSVHAAHRFLRPGLGDFGGLARRVSICGGRTRYGNRCENERGDAGCFLQPKHEQETLSDSRERVKAA